MSMPEDFRAALLARGHRMIEIGDLIIDLESGEHRRSIFLDGNDWGCAVFPSSEIDWQVVQNHLDL